MQTDEEAKKETNGPSTEDIEEHIKNFPAYMQMIPPLFEFSFHAANNVISKSVASSADLKELAKAAHDHIQKSDIDPELKDEVLSLIEGEIEVVGYAQSARCSVIAL